MSKPWNTTLQTSNFDKVLITEINSFYNDVAKQVKHARPQYAKDNPVSAKTRNKIEEVYLSGYGLKLISRELGIAYTSLRTVFRYLNIEIRKGRDVSTDVTKKFRSERVKGNKNPWYDWTHTHPEMWKTNSRGIQGYYTTFTGETIWLRSSWEYIFAKWLDSKQIPYKVEAKNYKLKNGETYRPDFTLFNADGSIQKIVEVKGFYKDRVYKVQMFRDEYPDITLEMVDDISPYCINSDYYKELTKWKLLKSKN